MNIVFINQDKSFARIPRKAILSIFGCAKKAFPKKIGSKSVSIVFETAAKSKELNARYRRKNYATNVLSFESRELGELGDIIICPTAAKAQAKEMNIGFYWWIGYLFAHGLLHLIGFDHKTKQQEKKMDLLTRKILQN